MIPENKILRAIGVLLILTAVTYGIYYLIVTHQRHLEDKQADDQTRYTMTMLSQRIVEFRYKNKTWPLSLKQILSSGSQKGISLKDAWGNRFIFRRKLHTCELQSLGADGRRGTEDDILVIINTSGKYHSP